MKIFLSLLVATLLFCSFASSHSLPELEKVKEIKLLESTRDDVRRILADYELGNARNCCIGSSKTSKYKDLFITKNAQIEVSYSDGNCSDDESDGWNVDEWKAVEIRLHPKSDLKFQEIGFDGTKFKKERVYRYYKQPIIYHRKELGISFEMMNNTVSVIRFEPQKKYLLMLCDKEKGMRLFKSSSYFDPKYGNDGSVCIYKVEVANVTDLVVSSTEIIIGNSSPVSNDLAPENNKIIAISTVVENPQNDVLAYDYKISGGKILSFDGKSPYIGRQSWWDLSNVPAGTYTITAAVDNGCGFCGKTITKTVVVKECPDCKKP